jgi:hypothetical protein
MASSEAWAEASSRPAARSRARCHREESFYMGIGRSGSITTPRAATITGETRPAHECRPRLGPATATRRSGEYWAGGPGGWDGGERDEESTKDEGQADGCKLRSLCRCRTQTTRWRRGGRPRSSEPTADPCARPFRIPPSRPPPTPAPGIIRLDLFRLNQLSYRAQQDSPFASHALFMVPACKCCSIQPPKTHYKEHQTPLG